MGASAQPERTEPAVSRVSSLEPAIRQCKCKPVLDVKAAANDALFLAEVPSGANGGDNRDRSCPLRLRIGSTIQWEWTP